MLFLFQYLKIGLWATIYYFNPNDITFDIIINNIKKSGPVLIKLIQWVLPKIESFYNLDKNEIQKKKLTKLEELYENCQFHSLEYTKKMYQQEFEEELSDKYKDIQEIASGSIGQVYKVTDEKDNEYALKILHPDTETQILFFNLLFKLVKILKPIHNKLNYYFPIDLETFIKDFRSQTNFINEANNNLVFSKIYDNNPYVIIPKLMKVSKNILIMDYEEGEIFVNSKFSEYISWKTISLIKLFNKNNETIFNFMHGDLHKANWKVRIIKSEVKIIIYDFGFCWNIPECITKNLVFLNHTFMELQVFNSVGPIPDSLKNDLAKVCSIFTDNKISVDSIKPEINKILEIDKISPTDPFFFLKLMLTCTRKGNITLDSYVLGCIIGHNQMSNLYKIVFEDNFEYDNKKLNEKFVYSQYFDDLINFCETNNIFIDYVDYLKNEVRIEKQMRNIKTDSLFLLNETLENNSKIKAMCIPKDN